MIDDGSEEFAAYLAKRKTTKRLTFAGLLLLFVAVVAVPYALMRAHVMEKDVFEIFVFVDIVVLIGAIRAAVTAFKDSAF